MASWVQCDLCSKWRRLPENVPAPSDDTWNCSLNSWDPANANCSAPEDPEAHLDEVMPQAPPVAVVDVDALQLKWPSIPKEVVIAHPEFYKKLDDVLFEDPSALTDAKSRKAMAFPLNGRQPLDLYSLYHYTRAQHYLLRHENGRERSDRSEKMPEHVS